MSTMCRELPSMAKGFARSVVIPLFRDRPCLPITGEASLSWTNALLSNACLTLSDIRHRIARTATVPCPLLSAANSDGMPALRNLVEHHQRSAHLLVLPGIERCRLTVTASVAVDEIPDDGFLDIETPP